jgi:hypothetical protein
MQKLALIIGSVLLLAGVATAGTFAGIGSSGDDSTLSTQPPPTTTATTTGDVRRDGVAAGVGTEAAETTKT